jgi:hypothetical protein
MHLSSWNKEEPSTGEKGEKSMESTISVRAKHLSNRKTATAGSCQTNRTKQTPRPESSSELYRPSDRRLSATLVPTSVDRGCHVVNVTDPYGRILGFLDREQPTLINQRYIWSRPGRVKNILFSTALRPAVRTTQPPVQWAQFFFICG